MYFPPAMIFLTACTSSSGILSLVRYPSAPARRTRMANWSSGCILSTSTGVSGQPAFNSCKASSPLLPGIVRSNMTKFHGCCPASSSSSGAVDASPITAS